VAGPGEVDVEAGFMLSDVFIGFLGRVNYFFYFLSYQKLKCHPAAKMRGYERFGFGTGRWAIDGELTGAQVVSQVAPGPCAIHPTGQRFPASLFGRAQSQVRHTFNAHIRFLHRNLPLQFRLALSPR
jgi:hypothetical protein